MKINWEKRFNDYLSEKYQINIDGQMVYIDGLGEEYYKQAPEVYNRLFDSWKTDEEERLCIFEDDYLDNEYLYDLAKGN